jgi:glycosyltransferase involved in cell wall biosynthesis
LGTDRAASDTRPAPQIVGRRRRIALACRGGLRRLVLLATLGDNAVTDLLRDLYGNLQTMPYLPETLHLTKSIPILGGRARDLTAMKQQFVTELEKILDRVSGQRTLFVNHLPLEVEALIVTSEVHRRDVPIGLEHHTGWPKGRNLLFRRVRPLARRVGGVYISGLEDHLGRDAVDLGNGIDTGFFDPAKAASTGAFRSKYPQLRPDSRLILAPGIIASRKRQLDILRAVRTLAHDAAVGDFQVVIVGHTKEPEYRERLERYIEKNALQRPAVLLEHLSPAELRDAYVEADVGVLASRFEGRPRVVLEMGAMGVPVVVADADASRDTFVPGRSGHLVNVADPVMLTGAVRDLLLDDAKRTEFGNVGSRFVRKHYTLGKLADRHESFCLDILNEPGPHSSL